MQTPPPRPLVALACGGTGGHLFPGLAIADALQQRGCDILLLVSPKEVDQQAVRSLRGMRVETLPAVGLSRGGVGRFALGFFRSLNAARRIFKTTPPRAVLAMGGFTSAPPVLAGKRCGAATFFHEANAIPGRANRLLAHVVNEAFVGFATATDHLFLQRVTTTGTPVRSQFIPQPPAGCRAALGLKSDRPVLLVVGGSQGASGVNDLVLAAQPLLTRELPELQILHLTGAEDFEKVRAAWAATGQKAVVRPFLTEMELALGAATVAVSRAGASALAEFAAVRLPTILVPYPAAVDNHQLHNAMALVRTGAAALLEQRGATGEQLARQILDLLRDPAARVRMTDALAAWHFPAAAEHIAGRIAEVIGCPSPSLAMGAEVYVRPLRTMRCLTCLLALCVAFVSGCTHSSSHAKAPVGQTIASLHATANDPRAEADKRCISIFSLFRHFIKLGSTPQEIHEVLGGTGWLDRTNIHAMNILAGLIPVEWDLEDDTPFVVSVLPGIKPSVGRPPDLGYQIYFTLSGGASRTEESAFAILSGRRAPDTKARLVEFALCYPDGTIERFSKRRERKTAMRPNRRQAVRAIRMDNLNINIASQTCGPAFAELGRSMHVGAFRAVLS